jgi:hypothetical protein
MYNGQLNNYPVETLVDDELQFLRMRFLCPNSVVCNQCPHGVTVPCFSSQFSSRLQHVILLRLLFNIFNILYVFWILDIGPIRPKHTAEILPVMRPHMRQIEAHTDVEVEIEKNKIPLQQVNKIYFTSVTIQYGIQDEYCRLCVLKIHNYLPQPAV